MRNSAVFNTLFKQGKSFHSTAFVCFYQNADICEVGFVASKKVGNAVGRNYARRLLREIFRAEIDRLPKGRYALVAKKPIGETDFAQLKAQFARAIQIFKKNT